jgi:hypothetical protein
MNTGFPPFVSETVAYTSAYSPQLPAALRVFRVTFRLSFSLDYRILLMLTEVGSGWEVRSSN